jgi:hypothetical protein
MGFCLVCSWAGCLGLWLFFGWGRFESWDRYPFEAVYGGARSALSVTVPPAIFYLGVWLV